MWLFIGIGVMLVLATIPLWGPYVVTDDDYPGDER